MGESKSRVGGAHPAHPLDKSLEAASVNEETVDDWKSRSPGILEDFNANDVYNCDETSIFFKMMPDRSLIIEKGDCRGGKRSKERYRVLLCTKWTSADKLKPLAIGEHLFILLF